MGGLSEGNRRVEGNTLLFSGNIYTKNNGGFSSVFKKTHQLQVDITSIAITVEGDGETYQLRLRTKVMGYDLAYKVNFQTKANHIQTHYFQLDNFKAYFRGRIINNAPLLQPSNITHVGFLFSSKKTSNFTLSIYDIIFV